MVSLDALKEQLGAHTSLEPVEINVVRLYSPFFHEDGDMHSVYIEMHDTDIVLRDFGSTLMRVQYTFDIDTENKQNILNNIVKSNFGELQDGELVLHTNAERLSADIRQFHLLISKVSNIDILKRDVERTKFYDYLYSFMMETFHGFRVRERFIPTDDRELVVDYMIPGNRPFYIFGVSENTKASKVVISCLRFREKQLPFRGVVIHENPESLSLFNRHQIMNTADKLFASLPDFQAGGLAYIQREIA